MCVVFIRVASRCIRCSALESLKRQRDEISLWLMTCKKAITAMLTRKTSELTLGACLSVVAVVEEVAVSTGCGVPTKMVALQTS